MVGSCHGHKINIYYIILYYIILYYIILYYIILYYIILYYIILYYIILYYIILYYIILYYIILYYIILYYTYQHVFILKSMLHVDYSWSCLVRLHYKGLMKKRVLCKGGFLYNYRRLCNYKEK